MVQPAIAGVGQRQLVLGLDLLQYGDTLLEVERCQRCLDLRWISC